MRFTLYKFVPTFKVKKLPWGVGFATPLFLVIADNASEQTPDHEFKHFLDWWQFLIIGTILGYTFFMLLGYYNYRKLRLSRKKALYQAYRSNWFERRARKYAGQE